MEKLLVSTTKRARIQDECTNSGLSLCMYSNDKADPSCCTSTANTSSNDVQKSYGSFNYDVQSTEPAGADNTSPVSLDLNISLGALWMMWMSCRFSSPMLIEMPESKYIWSISMVVKLSLEKSQWQDGTTYHLIPTSIMGVLSLEIAFQDGNNSVRNFL